MVMKFTLFSSLYKKEAQSLIEAAEWVEYIRNGKYRNIVEKIRSHMETGLKDEAREMKMKLPAVVCAGDCREGRFFAKTKDRTGLVMLDFDNVDREVLKKARMVLEALDYVAIVHVTASGKGLRVMVNMGVVHIDVYRAAYEVVAATLKELTGLEPDMQCKDFARTSLASYDPDVYFNPDAKLFDFGSEWNPMSYVPVTGPDTSEDFRVQRNAFAREGQKSSPQRCEAHRDVQWVIDRFFERNMYAEGNRHNTLLHLGGYLRWMGVESWQMDEAMAIICRMTVQPGMPEKEVREAVKWGYENGDEGVKTGPWSAHCAHKYNMNTFSFKPASQTADNENDENEEPDEEEIIDAQCSPIDDAVFEQLPEELTKLLVIAKDKRERDVILLSAITMLSCAFPALRTTYGNQKYSAHLYSCIVAHAGAGKGLATLAVGLLTQINAELDRIYREQKKEYEQKLLEWELEVRIAAKEKRVPNLDMKPEEPVRQVLLISPTTSKSQMILDLRTAGEDGLAMMTSEIDAMAEALNTDYGKHAAELRMFFHHEEVRQRYKVDKEPVVVEHPRMGILMTGTPEQASGFFKSMENGLYSRFLFYMMNSKLQWKSQSPLDGNGGIDASELFDKLGEKVKMNFFNTRGREIIINFTREQWDRHNEVFESKLGMLAAENSKNAGAIVLRAGLIAVRIAMVLCGLRLMEAGWQVNEFTCTDEDFDNAVKIAVNALNHSAHMSTMLNESMNRKKVKNFFRLLPVLKTMKNTFRYCEFRDAVVSTGSNTSAARRALKKYVESGLLSSSNGVFNKTRKLKKMFIYK